MCIRDSGKAKPGSNYPALYLIGVVNGQYGFFRSDDAAVSWVRWIYNRPGISSMVLDMSGISIIIKGESKLHPEGVRMRGMYGKQ